MPVPVMLLDESSKVLFVNESMRGVVGRRWRRSHQRRIAHPDALNAISQTIADGEPATAQFTLPCRSSATMRPIAPGERGAHRDRAGAARSDRDPQKRADAGGFRANASHELRTPLRVSGFIDTLRGHAKTTERRENLDIMGGRPRGCAG